VWKKTEDEANAAAPSPATPQTTAPSTPPPQRSSTPRSPAVIGSSILVKGDIEGGEDLTIQGRVEGKVRLQKHHVSVGQGGFLKGDIHGKSVHVEGEVRGNLYGTQEVILRTSGVVQGNIVSPRVTLENGSRFKGSIDMEGAGTEEKPVAQSSVSGRPDGGESTSARPDTASKPTSEGSKAADKATAAGAG
jgi:cytoskeletal protein CcmA (bactofilin family)